MSFPFHAVSHLPMMSGGGGGQPVFIAPLTTSIVASRVLGAATFTRATTATILDWESITKNVLSGEARFKGARRVRNLVSGIDPNGWLTSASVSVATGVADPVGGTSAVTVTATGPGGYRIDSHTIASGVQVRNSMWIRRRTGVGTISMLDGSDADGLTDVTAAITTSWQRIATAVKTAAGVGSNDIGINIGTNGDAVDLWHPQMENVTGQTNQNPSEFVSVGVLAAPYQGANVDGVQYFGTQNGNTVVGNVVTEATGAAISTSTLLGYLSEEQRTNLVLQSSNFGVTWAAVGTPTRVAANDLCGDIALDLIGDNDGAALEGYTQTITYTGNAVKSVTVMVKQGTSTSTVIRVRDTTAGADRLMLAITWAAGVPVSTYTTGSEERPSVAHGNGVYRIYALTSAVTAANVNSLQIYPATTAALLVANTGTISVGGVQSEDGPFATSLIPTTTATVTRNGDALSYPAAGNFSDTVGTAFCETSGVLGTAVSVMVSVRGVGATGGAPALWSGASPSHLQIYDGAAFADPGQTVAIPSTAINKVAVKWDQTPLCNSFLNGVAGVAKAWDGNMNHETYLSIGSNAAGSALSNLNGTVRNVKVWTRTLSDGEAIAL